MARFKDTDWNLPLGSDGRSVETWEQACLAVLMDVRDELKRLNAALYCPNFQHIPRTLREIKRNTTKRKKAKP